MQQAHPSLQTAGDEPQSAEDLKGVGNLLRQMGRLNDAAGCYRRAILLRPDYPEAFNNLGNTVQDLGQLDEAVAHYRHALALRPDFAECLNNLGNALKAQGQLVEAVACYRRALDLNETSPEVHNNLGLALATLHRPDEAAACYRRAIALAPDYPQAHNNLGAALQQLGCEREAAACYATAIALQPAFAEAHNNLGNVLKAQGLLSEAAGRYRRALELKPNSPQIHNNLGAMLQDQGAPDQAVACYLKALALRPHFPEAYNNLGASLAEAGRFDEAIACYDRALALDPDLAEAYNNLGSVRREQMRLDEAVACYRNAIARKPDFPGAHNNLAIALLAQGDLPAGFAEYEWRWQTPQMSKARRFFPRPQWHGEAGHGRTLLIHAEQGLGDTVQFCRYGTLAAAQGLRVIMEVQRPLLRLLRDLPGVRLVARGSVALPAFDLHCPMLSLPKALGTTLATIPCADAYLQADRAQEAAWRQRLPDGALRVGLVWAGNPRSHSPALAAVDRRRSLPPDLLAPLFELSGVAFVSLQKGGPPAPAHLPMTDFMAEMTDFADTAALIMALDLVISVDTAVAHLAAALGKPVWLLDRFDSCWRWLTNRRDSPWYPSLRLYRQPEPGAWAPVLADIARDLNALL